MERKQKIILIHAVTSKLYKCRICGKIHAGHICLECGPSALQDVLKGFEYEKFLYELTGKTSCKDMADEDLEHVISILRGLKLESEIEARKRTWVAKQRLKAIIRNQAFKMFGSSAQYRVDGFCCKCIGKPFERLEEKELRKVIGWLRRLEKNGKIKGYTEGEKDG